MSRARCLVRGVIAAIAACCLLARAHAQDVTPEVDWAGKEGRVDLARLVRGEVDAAIASLAKKLERRPGDAEYLFLMALARAHAGEGEAALASARGALEQGLPPERFTVGPRDEVRPLLAVEGFSELLASRVPRLVHGPLVGSVTDSSARVWVRTSEELDVTLEYRRVDAGADADAEAEAEADADADPDGDPDGDGDASDEASGAADGERPWRRSVTARSLADRDLTAVVVAEDLEPGAHYEYRVRLGDAPASRSGSFRTFPDSGEPARFTVAFGGGAAYAPPYEGIFRHIRAREPLAFLQLGDNVYVDEPTLPAAQRYCYYRRQSSEPYRELVSSTCIAAIWDDHDFGTNDCHGGPEIESPPWKRRVWEVFRENWNNPAWGGGAERPGCWFDFHIADVHFILLDCRYYRTSPTAEERSMLGAEQKAWLLERLASSTARLKVIASSVPFTPGVKPGSRDTWDGYAEEREEIFGFIAERRIDGVVLIAADRHRSDAWRIERPGAYDLYEFQSSRLTNEHRHRLFEEALFGYNDGRSFGLLDFDTESEDPRVTYSVVDEAGDVVHAITLRLSELGFES